MNIGLPGTGIGGLFYLLSVLVMLIWEILLTIRSRSSLKRWALVSKQVSHAVGIILAIGLTGFLLGLLIPRGIAANLSGINTNSSISTNARFVFLSPFLFLFGVLLSSQLLRVFFKILKR